MKVLSVRKINSQDIEQLQNTSIYVEALRRLRDPLLKAFDIYKSNVYYGVINETEEEHQQILNWYQQLLDLQEIAIKEVPTGIMRFV